MTTKELLENYYKGCAEKQGWETVISDDLKFVGSYMAKTDPIVCKEAYIDIIKRFSRLFQNIYFLTHQLSRSIQNRKAIARASFFK